jgi:hypothetical protein
MRSDEAKMYRGDDVKKSDSLAPPGVTLLELRRKKSEHIGLGSPHPLFFVKM